MSIDNRQSGDDRTFGVDELTDTERERLELIAESDCESAPIARRYLQSFETEGSDE